MVDHCAHSGSSAAMVVAPWFSGLLSSPHTNLFLTVVTSIVCFAAGCWVVLILFLPDEVFSGFEARSAVVEKFGLVWSSPQELVGSILPAP